MPPHGALLRSRQGALSAAIEKDMRGQLAGLHGAPPLDAGAWAEAVVAACLDLVGRGDEAALERAAGHFLELARRGGSLEDVMGALAACRRHFLRQTADPHATAEDLDVLMDAFDAIARSVCRFYEAALRDYEDLEQSHAQLAAIIDNAFLVIFAKDLAGRLIFTNPAFDAFMGLPKEKLLGRTDHDLLPPPVADANRRNDLAVIESGQTTETEEVIPGKGGMHTYWAMKFPLRDARGVIYGVCGIAADITPVKRAEEERASLQGQIIEAQHAALRQLSTPLLPIAEGIVLMPLIGAIDTVRAGQVLETLLEGVVAHRARIVILDITGVQDVDEDVASGIVQAAQAARLLGAQVLLTGVRAATARALMDLSIDLGSLVTLSSLERGVAHALVRARAR
ncbi:PAS domain-containing protein [Polyangium aurulentum]|uniref:PAS domain-containing protein n=1 Tax=Polyangium aurulentum TaxID=2567896 RepID=UPI00146CAA1F|nr:PAS domain-containing protein [Polyangium aurulentum]UQA56124.1 PAS domain-containing protein [Polyangium aurulentum]